MVSLRFSERVRTDERASTNPSSEKDSTSPVEEETVVPDARRWSFRMRLLSVNPIIASSNDCPFAAIATGIPFTTASDTALSLAPALRWPVTCSSSAAASIDITASEPPFPSLRINPSGSVAAPSA